MKNQEYENFKNKVSEALNCNNLIVDEWFNEVPKDNWMGERSLPAEIYRNRLLEYLPQLEAYLNKINYIEINEARLAINTISLHDEVPIAYVNLQASVLWDNDERIYMQLYKDPVHSRAEIYTLKPGFEDNDYRIVFHDVVELDSFKNPFTDYADIMLKKVNRKIEKLCLFRNFLDLENND